MGPPPDDELVEDDVEVVEEIVADAVVLDEPVVSLDVPVDEPLLDAELVGDVVAVVAVVPIEPVIEEFVVDVGVPEVGGVALDDPSLVPLPEDSVAVSAVVRSAVVTSSEVPPPTPLLRVPAEPGPGLSTASSPQANTNDADASNRETR